MIYPVDVAKTLYQKALLSAGSAHVDRPPIRVFQAGAYRGESADMKFWDGLLTIARSRRIGLEIMCYQHDLLQQFRVCEEEYQCIGCLSVEAMVKLNWRCEITGEQLHGLGVVGLVRREMSVERRRAPGYVAYVVDTEVTLRRQAVHRAVRRYR